MKTPVQALLLVFLSASLNTHAQGMPVFDAAAYAQAVQQVQAWRQQYQQMALQLKQLQDQRDAMTGTRGMGNIMNDPLLKTLVPDDAAQVFDAIRSSGSQALSPQARQLRLASKIYDCENRGGADLATCRAFLNTSAQTYAYQQTAMVRLNQRLRQLEGLQGAINTTTDPKSIAELSARLIAESAQVANDANRLAVLRATADMADRTTQQALKERELLMLSRRGDGSDTFVYRPYTGK